MYFQIYIYIYIAVYIFTALYIFILYLCLFYICYIFIYIYRECIELYIYLFIHRCRCNYFPKADIPRTLNKSPLLFWQLKSSSGYINEFVVPGKPEFYDNRHKKAELHKENFFAEH